MACFHPLKAWQEVTSRQVFFYERNDSNAILLPCGQCIGCRLERSRQWAVRCTHEAKLHSANSFITLTYSPEHFPANGSLNYSHFQLFLKRLRRRIGKVRFYMAGEYGEDFLRPHFHALIFGYDFPDKKLFKQLSSGSMIYRSEFLESLWPYGFSSVGDCTFEAAAYVARYVMKKVTGRPSLSHYEVLDYDTGEITRRVPEFNKMSLKPGIGADWYAKYASDVFPHDRVIINARKTKPPRYYDKLLDKSDPLLYEDIKYQRFLDSLNYLHDNTDARLHAKEIVTQARISQLKRTF
ncbi:MAG: replication initiator protein [Microvirus sp.]|nr:MAG: replication initiator protein [Microvirus sp.]